jgi:hypothetical protein
MPDFTEYTTADSEDTYAKQSVEIVPEAIREEFVRVPSDMAFWGERYAEAVRAYLVAEQNRKATHARLRLTIRSVAAAGGTKMTEADVEAHIESAPEYQNAKLAEIEAEAAKLAAKTRFDAVAAKRDMCMSLGAHIRSEMSPHQIRRNDY